MPKEQDVELGRLAVERGLITHTQLDECLAEIADRLSASEYPSSDSLSLVTLLIDKGYVSPDEITELLRMRHTYSTGAESTPGGGAPDEVLRAAGLPDSRFGKYTIVRLIGSGGMGAVYRAWDNDLRRIVALKFLTLGTEENVRRFMREAQTAARLNHPNIAQIYDAGTVDHRHYIALEYVDGMTLDALPESVRRDDLSRILKLMREVCLAVEYAHSKGIVHRDLKPQNIMVDDDLVPHVMDFGLARALAIPGLHAKTEHEGREITVSGTVVGTPSYVPPEQARGDQARTDVRSDVYALGATLYALVTGRPPFLESTPMDTIMAVIQREPMRPRVLNPSLPRDVETVVLKCLAKDPVDRYASARELGDELQRILASEPIVARRAGAGTRALSAVRRHPGAALSILSILVIAAIAGGLAWSLVRRHEQRERERREAELRDRLQREAERRRATAEPLVAEGRRALENAERMLYQPGFVRAEFESRVREALGRLDLAVESDATWAEAFAVRARAHALLGNDSSAMADYGVAIELQGGDSPFWSDRGQLRLLVALRRTRALSLLAPALPRRDLKPPAPCAALMAAAALDFAEAAARGASGPRHDGWKAAAEGRWSDAAASLAQAESNDAEARLVLALALLRLGRVPDALAEARRALAARPNGPDSALLVAALESMSGGDPAESMAVLDRLGVDRAIRHLLVGNRLAASGSIAAAVDEYAAAIELEPTDPVARVNRAWLTRESAPDAARADLDEVVARRLEAAELALALRAPLRRQTADQEADAEAAVRENDRFAPAWRALEAARRERGNLAGAEEARIRAESLEPR